MPIFGLVWVASWVGCFFPSSNDLLQAPSHPPCVLPEPAFSASSAPSIFPPAQAAPAQGTWLPVSHTAAETGSDSASQSLLKVFKRFFQVATIPAKPAPAVVVTEVKANRSSDSVKGSASGGVGFGQCLPTLFTDDLAVTEALKRFQVKLKNSVIGEFSTQKQAAQVAQRLERFLNNPKLNAAEIQPVLVKGLPAVKWGDRILFTLNKELTQSLTCNSEILAIEWANNLRLALKQSALEIAEAQEKMHGLETTNRTIEGMASWYGPYFHGRQTATGETFDETEFTAAHPSLPFDTYLKVTNLTNGKSVIVRVNDRGPYFKNRALDLSREAARSLDSEKTGVVPIEAVIMKPVPTATNPSSTVAKL
jgi:rare lipoprotein A